MRVATFTSHLLVAAVTLDGPTVVGIVGSMPMSQSSNVPRRKQYASSEISIHS